MRGKQANTTALIGAWTMSGAHGDFDGHFRPVLDINAIVEERGAEPVDEVVPPERPPLLMKPAGEDDWRPLPAVA
jgi:hypothetical protein